MEMRIKTLSVSLPENLARYVKGRAEEHGNLSDYIRSLIREDRKRQEQEHLEKLLLEGLASGFKPIEDWEGFKADMLKRLKQ